MEKRLEIFRAGRHTAIDGRQIEFSEADLQATVAAYDPGRHEAPLVIGHPNTDDPAWGWIKALSFSEGVISAGPDQVDQVDPVFAEMVNAGRFKKISGSFYLPDAPNNPVPGVYYLRHVGFLGARPPAIKGLKSASFAAGEEGVVEFGDWSDQVEAGLFRKLRDWLIGKFGQEEADKALPAWDVDLVQTETARKESDGNNGSAFAESHKQIQEDEELATKEELAAKEADLQQRETACAEREARMRQAEQKTNHRRHLSFVEGLIREGKPLAGGRKDQAVALLDFAAGCESQTIEFGEGENKQVLAVAAAFETFLADLPKVVEFGEVVKPDGGGSTVDFAAAPGYTVDAEALELHSRAMVYQAKHPGIGYMDAVRAVQ